MANPLSYPTTPLFTRPTSSSLAPTPFSTTLPPTQSSTTLPTPLSTLLTQPLSPLSPGNILANGSSTITAIKLADPPGDLILTGATTLGPPGVLITSTAASGIFGVGTHLDPLIIFGLLVGGLLLLLFVAGLIYCCCRCCGVSCRRDYVPPMRRTSSMRSISYIEEPYFVPPPKPLMLRASIGPDYSTRGTEPAASVLLDQPIRVNVGAYAVGDGNYGSMVTKNVMASYPRRVRQEVTRPDVIVTRRSTPVVRTVRKNYLYPADSIGMASGLTYNTVRPKVITTLGDGYVTGRSLRSTGGFYGNNLFYLDDSPQIITLD